MSVLTCNFLSFNTINRCKYFQLPIKEVIEKRKKKLIDLENNNKKLLSIINKNTDNDNY